MKNSQNTLLSVGATLSGLVALIHVGCLIFGAPWYRFLGAGEQMAQMDLAGHWYPKVITCVIALIFFGWALYALSAAGVVRKLPFLRIVLCLITATYLLRAIAFVPLQTYFPDNGITFWIVSSGICFAIGLIHLVGLRQAWPRLSVERASATN